MKSLNKNFLKLDRLLKQKWEQIAYHYYTDYHPTTRNFDAVIDFYLPSYLKRVPKQGLFLDLGGGRGKLHQFMQLHRSKIIVGDISINMLKIEEETSQDFLRIQLSAFHLPFRNGIFDGVISILGDPYVLPEVFQEVWRILKFEGIFIIALPSKLWASTLRPKIRVPLDKTVFTNKIYGTIKVPSFSYSEIELKNHLLNAKFRNVKVRSFTAKHLIQKSELSPHILIPCKNLGISPYDLPIVTIASACKDKNKTKIDIIRKGDVPNERKV